MFLIAYTKFMLVFITSAVLVAGVIDSFVCNFRVLGLLFFIQGKSMIFNLCIYAQMFQGQIIE